MVVQCAKHWSELGLTYCNFSSSNKGDEERKKKRRGKQIQGIFLLDPGLDYRQLECFTNKKVISPLHNITYPFLISERHLIFSISSKKRINLRMHSSLSFPLTPPHLAAFPPSLHAVPPSTGRRPAGCDHFCGGEGGWTHEFPDCAWNLIYRNLWSVFIPIYNAK